MTEHKIDPELAAALVRSQGRIRDLPLDGENRHHGYSYVTAESIISAARFALVLEGLVLVEMGQRFEILDAELGVLTTERMLVHTSGATMPIPTRSWPVIPGRGRPWDKAIAGASTAALGYSLRGLLLIARGAGDADMDRRDDRDHTPPAVATKADRIEAARVKFGSMALTGGRLEKVSAALEAGDLEALGSLYQAQRAADAVAAASAHTSPATAPRTSNSGQADPIPQEWKDEALRP